MPHEHPAAANALTVRARISWIAWRAFGTLGVVTAGWSLLAAGRQDSLGYDLNRIALRASDAFAHGRPLYLTTDQWRRLSTAPFAYVYPPFYAEVISPLLLLPDRVSAILGTVVCLAAVILALWIVGVRDPRVYTVAMCSYPVLNGAQVANASLLLLPLLALAWKHRGPLPVAVAMAIKPILWCMLIWLWLSRGRRAAARALLILVGLLVVSWAAIGFDGLTSYVSTLRWNDRSQAGITYGLSTSLPHGGILALVAAAAALALAWRRARAADEIGVLTYCVFASLLTSPIVWMHSFTILLIPLALRRPSFTPAWLVVVAAWFAVHSNTTAAPGITKLAVWLVVGGLSVWLGQGALERRKAPAPPRRAGRARAAAVRRAG